MTTLTLSPPLIDTQAPAPVTESRLDAAGDTIHYAVWLCASRYHQVRLLEDMEQEARLRVWIKLKDNPGASEGLIWTVAYRAAYDLLIRGTSVDKPKPLGNVHYIVDSLEAMMEGKDGLDTIDDALARRRRDELPNPTEDIAVARIMEQELRECLTPRQRQVLTLHLRGCTENEIAGVLGIVQSWVSRTVTAIREKAKVVWGDTPPKPTRIKHSPEERRELRRLGNKRRHKAYWARHRDEIIARQRAKRALHRDECNARQRDKRRERRRESLGQN